MRDTCREKECVNGNGRNGCRAQTHTHAHIIKIERNSAMDVGATHTLTYTHSVTVLHSAKKHMAIENELEHK